MSEEIPIIYITAAAVQQIKKLQNTHDQIVRLRVYIEGGGCSGFQYKFKLEEIVSEEDMIIPAQMSPQEDSSIVYPTEIVVDTISLAYLQDATIDYTKSLSGSRFQVVNNPNAHVSCGCGSSFSV